jgi:Zn-dependent peptidase ImmA (M78 family)/transcriptional regulator with XRE-family HTH domain
MRVGTPGFVAQRLTEAREARGLAQTALSELTGIKSQSISHYEQGRQSPSPEALVLLCEKLDLPERYFLHPVPGHSMRGIFFRSLRPQTRTARIKAERRIGWLKEIVAYLRRHIDLPAPGLPNHPVAPTGHDASAEIEKIAEACREQFGSGHGPVTGMVMLAENLGCIISRGFPDCEPESACSHWDRRGVEGEDTPFLLLPGNAGVNHTRFDAAHELGHLVMHRSLEPETADPETHRILEQQADRFARAFLLPAAVFGREVWAPTVDALFSLRKQWNCPLCAMVMRCGEIGIFNADQVRRASANLARRGWKTGEPSEEPSPGETPQLLAGCIRLLIEGGVKDRHALLTDLSLNPADIEDLAGLPRQYLSEGDKLRPASLKLRAEGMTVS